MSSIQNGYALVSMTNNDVYYIDKVTYDNLLDALKDQDDRHVIFIDSKSNKSVTVNIKYISSIVQLGGNQNA